jgi:pteridine reductase
MEPAGRVALVTGAGVRVGRTLALGLAREGARVAVHFNRSGESAAEVVGTIRDAGGEAVAIRGDLSTMEGVDRVVRGVEDAFGGADILVNNASVFPEQRLEETDPAVWERALAVNLRAPFFLLQKLAPTLRSSGHGLVVNIADLAGVQAWTTHVAHGISKAGLIQLTRVAARALAPEVRVNAIVPGTVLPPEGTAEAEVERLAKRAPLRRIGDASDVLEALLYLVRARFVTGEVMVVDGGRLLA